MAKREYLKFWLKKLDLILKFKFGTCNYNGVNMSHTGMVALSMFQEMAKL